MLTTGSVGAGLAGSMKRWIIPPEAGSFRALVCRILGSAPAMQDRVPAAAMRS
jgi:hypothetical protein